MSGCVWPASRPHSLAGWWTDTAPAPVRGAPSTSYRGAVVARDTGEQFAFEIIRRVTGYSVALCDDGTAPRMVDGTWTDQGGATHLVEVTRLMDPDLARLIAAMEARDDKLAVPRLAGQWGVSLDAPLRLDVIDQHIEDMLLHCEAHGLTRLSQVDWLTLDGWPLGRFVQSRDLDAWRVKGNNNGWAWIFPPGTGGFRATMDSTLIPWLEEALTSQQLERKVAKLNLWPGDHRHLFVGLGLYGVPFEVLDPFWDPDDVPTVAPALPEGLDGLWLCPQLRHAPLTWLPGRGWERQPGVLDE